MPEHSLVEIFPEVLGHKAEGTEEGPAKRVEICVPVIWVLTETLVNQSYEDKTRKKTGFERFRIHWRRNGHVCVYLKADVVLRTGTSPAGVSTKLVVLHLLPPVPVGVVVVELHPGLVPRAPGTVRFFVLKGEVLNALLCEHAHINLEAQKGKN